MPESSQKVDLLKTRYWVVIETESQLQWVCDEVANFLRDNQSLPNTLILGYGTYLALSLTIAKQSGYDKPPRLDKYANCKIIVDPDHEFRVTAIGSFPNDAWMQAVNALEIQEQSLQQEKELSDDETTIQ